MNYTFVHDYCGDFFDHVHDDRPMLFARTLTGFSDGLWTFLQEQFHIARKPAGAISSCVGGRMADPSLHYHTAVHVLSIFQFWQRIRDQARDLKMSAATELAIWFHDSVYVPAAPAGENESCSSLFMQAMLRPFLTDKQILEEASAIIDATARHDQPEVDPRAHLMLDLDLANIGWEWDAYCKVAACIRKEFGQYSDEEYNRGRRKFCEGMLSKGFIFRTPYMRQHYEQRAVDNLKRTIKMLS